MCVLVSRASQLDHSSHLDLTVLRFDSPFSSPIVLFRIHFFPGVWPIFGIEGSLKRMERVPLELWGWDRMFLGPKKAEDVLARFFGSLT